MKNTIAIGDIHGRTSWKDIVRQHPDDRIVFMGDYFDPYEDLTPHELVDNFLEIVELKKQRPDDVILLLGNHDMHYLDTDFPGGSRYDVMNEQVFTSLLMSHFSLFQYAYQEGKTIYTHAGMSNAWFEKDFNGILNPKEGEPSIADQLNDPTDEQRKAMYQVGAVRGGHSETGGIFWADRMETEFDPLKGYHQVAGHSQVNRIITEQLDEDTSITYIDCLGTSGEYYNNKN